MKTIIAKMGAIATALIIALSAPAASMADDTAGGIGGGGSNGTLTGAIHWKSIASDEVGNPYKEFLKRSGWDQATTESQIRARAGNIDACRKSKVIWYINHNATNKWVFNYQYTATHGSGWDNHRNGSGTIEKPHVKVGRVPTTSEIDTFKNWDRTKNGHRIDKKPGYTIICSGAFMPLPKKEVKMTLTEYDTDVVPHERKAIYSYTTSVKPQNIAGKYDPVGEQNLTQQASLPVKTNFGKLWDQVYRQEVKLNKAQLDTAVNAALEKDKKIDHGKLNLNAFNRTGLAEGGILNVYEHATYATVKTNVSTLYAIVSDCTTTQTWNDDLMKYNPSTTECVKRAPRAVSTSVSMAAEAGTQKNTGFYQIMTTHNNHVGFSNLVKSDSTIKLTGGGKLDEQPNTESLTRGTISSSAVSKKYAQQPTVLDFGDKNNTNTAKAATATLGFYDKEAAFICDNSTMTVNASKNGANRNVYMSQVSANSDTTGAISGSQVGNDFEYFRDNDPSDVKVDLWYPTDTNVVSYNGHKALTTTVSRWAEGTPGTQSKSGGKFTMTTGKEKLFTGSDQAKNLRNWNTDTFSNSTSTVLKGQATDFKVSSTWASEAKLPQVLNFKYEYAPTVSTEVHGQNIGFGSGSSQALGQVIKVSAPMEGYCYSKFGATSNVYDTDLMLKNTGSGTKNELDGRIAEGVNGKNGSSAADYDRNLVVRFIRATTE